MDSANFPAHLHYVECRTDAFPSELFSVSSTNFVGNFEEENSKKTIKIYEIRSYGKVCLHKNTSIDRSLMMCRARDGNRRVIKCGKVA